MGLFWSSEPEIVWEANEIPNKGTSFRIASFYYQHVIDQIESKYNVVLPMARVKLTDKTKIYRNDAKNAVEITYDLKDGDAINEVKELSDLISTTIESASERTDIMVPVWHSVEGSSETKFGVKENLAIEKLYLYNQHFGKMVKNTKVKLGEYDFNLSFKQEEKNQGEAISNSEDVQSKKLVRKEVAIHDDLDNYPKLL